MAWCRQATSHYLRQCRQRPISLYGITMPQWVNEQDVMNRADSRFAPSHWETSLQSHAISHWLGPSLQSALMMRFQGTLRVNLKSWDFPSSLLSLSPHPHPHPHHSPPPHYQLYVSTGIAFVATVYQQERIGTACEQLNPNSQHASTAMHNIVMSRTSWTLQSIMTT